MKYRVFEQAAAEAKAEIQELDAEIDRLKAKRELLQVAEALVRQVLAAVPMSADAPPPEEDEHPETRPRTPIAEQPALEDEVPERSFEALSQEESSGSDPDRTTVPPPAGDSPPPVDTLPDHHVAFLQTEEAPSDLSAAAEEYLTLPEQPSGDDARSDDGSESPSAEDPSDDPSANVAADTSDPPRLSFADLLARKEPFSLRKQGWPESLPADEGEIRKKLL